MQAGTWLKIHLLRLWFGFQFISVLVHISWSLGFSFWSKWTVLLSCSVYVQFLQSPKQCNVVLYSNIYFIVLYLSTENKYLAIWIRAWVITQLIESKCRHYACYQSTADVAVMKHHQWLDKIQIFFTRTSGKSETFFYQKTLVRRILYEVIESKCPCTFITSACWSYRIASSFAALLHGSDFL